MVLKRSSMRAWNSGPPGPPPPPPPKPPPRPTATAAATEFANRRAGVSAARPTVRVQGWFRHRREVPGRHACRCRGSRSAEPVGSRFPGGATAAATATTAGSIQVGGGVCLRAANISSVGRKRRAAFGMRSALVRLAISILTFAVMPGFSFNSRLGTVITVP